MQRILDSALPEPLTVRAARQANELAALLIVLASNREIDPPQLRDAGGQVAFGLLDRAREAGGL